MSASLTVFLTHHKWCPLQVQTCRVSRWTSPHSSCWLLAPFLSPPWPETLCEVKKKNSKQRAFYSTHLCSYIHQSQCQIFRWVKGKYKYNIWCCLGWKLHIVFAILLFNVQLKKSNSPLNTSSNSHLYRIS